MFVIFDPAPCAVTLVAEGVRPDLSARVALVKGDFERSYGLRDYRPAVAHNVCVYVQTTAPNPATVLRTSTSLN